MFLRYAVVMLALSRALSRGTPRHVVWPMILALAAFAASGAVDVMWGPIMTLVDPSPSAMWWLTRIGFCLEDIPKFGGIVILSAFALGEGLGIHRNRTVGDPARGPKANPARTPPRPANRDD